MEAMMEINAKDIAAKFNARVVYNRTGHLVTFEFTDKGDYQFFCRDAHRYDVEIGSTPRRSSKGKGKDKERFRVRCDWWTLADAVREGFGVIHRASRTPQKPRRRAAAAAPSETPAASATDTAADTATAEVESVTLPGATALTALIARDKVRVDGDAVRGIGEFDELVIQDGGRTTVYTAPRPVLVEVGRYLRGLVGLIEDRIITATELGVRRERLLRQAEMFPAK